MEVINLKFGRKCLLLHIRHIREGTMEVAQSPPSPALDSSPPFLLC